MHKNIFIALFAAIILLPACGGGKETPQSIARKWCELNAKMHQAPDGGPEYAKAREAIASYEEKIDNKYGKDAAFMDQVDDEIEKCEDESEGR